MSRANIFRFVPKSIFALILTRQITGFPNLKILFKHSASLACGASSVIKNKIRSLFFAASKATSSSSCPSVHLKPGDRPPTRVRGSAVSVCPAAARLGANQTGGWSE